MSPPQLHDVFPANLRKAKILHVREIHPQCKIDNQEIWISQTYDRSLVNNEKKIKLKLNL